MTVFIIPALLFNKEIKIMQITPDLIKYLESLARITLTEEEEKKVGGELQDILTYIASGSDKPSPILRAVVGATGPKRKSYFSNASLNALQIKPFA